MMRVVDQAKNRPGLQAGLGSPTTDLAISVSNTTCVNDSELNLADIFPGDRTKILFSPETKARLKSSLKLSKESPSSLKRVGFSPNVLKMVYMVDS